MLWGYSGLTQRQAGELLDLSTGAAVSMELKALAAAAKGKLRKKLTAIDKTTRAEIDADSEAPNFEN